MDDSYERQTETSSEHESDSAPRRSVADYFTKITVNGCNILGLLNFFAFFGLCEATISVVSPWSRTAGEIMVGLAAVTCCAADICARLFTKNRSYLARLFSPYTDGALIFVPLWTIYPVSAIVITLVILFKR